MPPGYPEVMADLLRVACVQLNAAPRQGGQPREGREARRAGRGDRRGPRRAAREVERLGSAGRHPGGAGASRERRDIRGDERLGARSTGSRSSAARSPSPRRAARSSRTRAPSSIRTASSSRVYRKIHLFDVEVGGQVYRESETEEPGDEPVVCDGRGLAARAHGLLRPALPGALPDPRSRRRGARDACRPRSRSSPARITGSCSLRARAVENQCLRRGGEPVGARTRRARRATAAR